MKLISHRGNTKGKIKTLENTPEYIDQTLKMGYDVEIDLWVIDNMLFLGHNKPINEIKIEWILDRVSNLWVHCKNIEAVEYFQNSNPSINYFWHEGDTLTLTSKNNIWAFPGKQPIKNSIAVMPEIHNDSIKGCFGVCSDYIADIHK
tara:strand:- start:670 stop:1110 length:441 start_codon:yes stop_codon:yes gene_type:complete